MRSDLTKMPFYSFGIKDIIGDYTIQLMSDGEVVTSYDDLYPNVKAARRAASQLLSASDVEGAYMRVLKVDDPSIVDFITKDRMKTRNYNGFDESDPNYRAKLKELKNARNKRKGRRKCCGNES